jgi:hypothetical protein
MLGAALYTLFIGANIYVIDWVLLPISFLMGIGAAILWTAQGVCIGHQNDMTYLSCNEPID